MPDVKLHLGDCLEILPTLTGVDAVITDPPYGMSYSSNHGASWQGRTINGDNCTTARDAIIEHFNGLPMAVFGTWKVQKPAGVRGVLVWDKGPAFGMGDLRFPWKPSWEEIYIFGGGWAGKRDEGVMRGHLVVSWESKGRKHPNQKPVSLLKAIIEKLPRNITILDPFMGSGSTGVACIETGRNFIGIELDPGYFSIAEKRIQEAQAQPALLEAVNA